MMAKGSLSTRTYDAADRQYFAGFIDDRARQRPIECSGGLDCWVEFGPPCMTREAFVDGRRKAGGMYCKGCGGTPEIAPADVDHKWRYRR